MTKDYNTIVEKSGLSLNLDQSEGKMTLPSLNFSSPKDIFSFSTSSVAIEEAQKSDPAFALKPLLLDNSQVDLAQGQLSSGETTLDQIFSWHNTQVINETNSAAAPLVQNNIQNALIAFGNNAYESLIPIKPFQSNDFGSFQSDFQPGKIAANALDVNNFQPPASNQVGIFYEAATDAEFAQAAGLKTELELPSEFDYVDIANAPLPALTPAIHDGRLIERLIEEELPRPQANPDINSYTEGSGTPVTGNVITNDDTNNGGPLTVIITPGTYQGTFGELTLNQNGTYTYTPYDPATNPATLQALNTPGIHQDVFNYTVENPNGNPTSPTVTIKIVTDPQANPDVNSYTEGSGTPVTGNVITNDDTNNGGTLTVITPGTYQGTFGELTLNQDGTYTYTPYDPATNPATLQALNTPGVHQDVFNYTGENADGEKASSTLTINILTDPQANPDTNSYTEGSGTPVTGNVITNDDTNSGGNLTVITPGTYQGTFGELTLNQDGTYTYTPYDPATNPATLQALNTPGVHQDVFNYTGENADGEKASSTLTINVLTKPPVPEANSYEFTTDIVGFIEGDPNEDGYFEHTLNNINILNDPAPGSNLKDFDSQNESISVYQISNATLTVGGQNVALTPSTLLSNDQNVVGEYDFTYEGRTGTIVEYSNGNIKIFSQDNGVFPFVDVGQQVVFKGDYSIINQDGVISTSTAPFEIKLDGTNVPIANPDIYEVNQAQLALGTYKFTTTILNNDDDGNPYIDQPLVLKTVFDGQTMYTDPVDSFNNYTPDGPTLVLQTANQPDQTIQLTHVTIPTVDPNAIAEYTASVTNPGGITHTTYTFDITNDGHVEVTRQGIDILLPGQTLVFHALYNVDIADNQAAISSPTDIYVNIDFVTPPPVPEPNSYEFGTYIVSDYLENPPQNDYYEYNLNGINIINDPDSLTGLKDYDSQNESISVYQISNATLTVAGENVALTPSTLFSSDPNVVGEYDFTYEGASATIVEYKNGNIEIFSQSTNVFPYIDVGQQVVFKGDYSIINQDGIISASTASFEITLDGSNIPTANPDTYQIHQAQLASGTYDPTPTMLDNDTNNNPYVNQPLIVKTVFDGQTLFTSPVDGSSYTPDGPMLIFQTANQPDQTIPLTHVIIPIVDPNAIAEYTASFGNPGDPNYTTLTFDITQNGQVEVTKQGLYMLSAGQSLAFQALYDAAIADDQAAVSYPTYVDVNIDSGFFPPVAEPNIYYFKANEVAPTDGSITTNFNNLNIITDTDNVYGKDYDPQGEAITVDQISNFMVTLPDGTVKTLQGSFDPGDPITVDGLGTFRVNVNGTISFTPDNPNEFNTLEIGQSLKIAFNYTDQNTDNTESLLPASVSIEIDGTSYPPVVEQPRYGNSPQLDGASSVSYDEYYKVFNTNSFPLTQETVNISTIQDPNTGQPQDISKYLVNTITLADSSSNLTVTFESEGAGYQNTIGWYQIDPNTGTISNVKLIWDNASAVNSDGNLVPGQTTASLGPVTQGEQIGFFLISDGYNHNANTDQIMSDINNGFGHLVFTTTESASGPVASINSTAPYLFYVPTDVTNASIKTPVELISATGSTGIYHTAASPENNFALNGDGLQHTIGSLIASGTNSAAVQIGFEDLFGPYGQGSDRDLNDDVFQVNLPVGAVNSRQADSNHINANFTDQDGTQLTHASIELSTSTGGLNGDTFSLSNFTVSTTADSEGYYQITTAGYTNLYIKGLGTSLSSSNSEIEIDIKGLDIHAHYQDVVNNLHLSNSLTLTNPDEAAGTRELAIQIFDENDFSSNISYIPYIVTHLTEINNTDVSALEGNQYINTDASITGQTIYGNNADDIYQIAGSGNTIFMGSGNNQVISTGGHSTIFAGSGNDTIYTSGGGNQIIAGSGNDYINTGAGADDIYVGTGQATIAFQTSDITSGSVDTIYNLITAQSGHANPTVIDLSQILQSANYAPGVSQIDNFVEIKEASNGTQATLEVDTTGQGNFTPLAIITGVSQGDIVNVFDGNLHQMVATH